jgi:hypothetical protein
MAMPRITADLNGIALYTWMNTIYLLTSTVVMPLAGKLADLFGRRVVFTMGVFYIESPAMRQLQKKTGRGDFAHIVIHSSIIRPAANKFITEYLRRIKGG